ncbi:unnamed protein product [Urochloa decumbens]|uniref:Cycloeucalenol cycloisomerase n=1 Tax=Urochloa decumbens TaxID=240449 RepID=A0ABC9GNJ7_9POAL
MISPMTSARRPAAGTKPKGGGGGGAGRRSAWLAADESKRWGEAFFLLYTPFWLTLCLGIIVPFKLYEGFTELEYLVVGLVCTVPVFLIPLFLVGKMFRICQPQALYDTLNPAATGAAKKADSVRSLKDRYWVKLCWMNNSFEAAWILALSYFIAYLETLAIANFPYYKFIDRDIMYKVGSLFYAIYFIISFPMFLRIDEKDEKWNLSKVAVDSLGAAMLVTILLDLWRIFLGPIVHIPESRQCGQAGLAWFPTQN